MQVNKFMEDLVKYYNDRLLAWIQQALNLLSVFSDNCGYQFKSRLFFHFNRTPIRFLPALLLQLFLLFPFISDTCLHGWLTLLRVLTISSKLFCTTFRPPNMARELRTLRLVCGPTSWPLFPHSSQDSTFLYLLPRSGEDKGFCCSYTWSSN